MLLRDDGDQLVTIRVILLEPLYGGNIGSVARVMMNFGCRDLVLVNPPPINDETRAFASSAIELLESATICETFEEAIVDADVIVGTTSKMGETENRHVRMPAYSPKALKAKFDGKKGNVSLVFGREDRGLSSNELSRCDIIAVIPTSASYPVMNISHAVAIFLYELQDLSPGQYPLADRYNKDLLYEHIHEFLHKIPYPPHKLEKTALMIKRILGRAELTGREVQTLRGVLKRTERAIKEGRESER